MHTVTIETTQSPADACYRCGYDLRGIADDQPCPECGLLARRSRRASDELHNTRPRWLRRISRGANLILLAIVVAVAWPFVITRPLIYRALQQWASMNGNRLWYLAPMLGFGLAAMALLGGGLPGT